MSLKGISVNPILYIPQHSVSIRCVNENEICVQKLTETFGRIQVDEALLFQKAREIRRIEPWKRRWDRELIGLADADGEVQGLISILGGGKEVFAIHLYLPPGGFHHWELLNEGVELDPQHFMGIVRMLEMGFAPKSDLDKEDRKILERAEYPNPGKIRHGWAQGRSYVPRHHPWYLVPAEYAPLYLALSAVSDYESMFSKAQLKAWSEELEQSPIRRIPVMQPQVSGAGELTWKAWMGDFPEIPLSEKPISGPDEGMIRDILSQNVSTLAWSVGTELGLNPVQEKADERPILPRIGLVVENKDGEILHAVPNIEPEMGPWEIWQFTLAEAIMNVGYRPAKVYSRTPVPPEVQEYWKEKLRIPIEENADCPELEDALDSLANYI